MFISLLLISRATSTEPLICGSSLNPSNFSSKSAMEANGWVYNGKGKDSDFGSEDCSSYCENVNATSYCGLCNSGPGQLSLTLELSGYEKGELIIDYGASNDDKMGTSLFLNGKSRESTTELSRKFEWYFVDGDTLMLSKKNSVIVINSIDFDCFTSPPVTAPSTSPSPRPSSSNPTDREIPTHRPTSSPTTTPTRSPTANPSSYPTDTAIPTHRPTSSPTTTPTRSPTSNPSSYPKDGAIPTRRPTSNPTTTPTRSPTSKPSSWPKNTATPTYSPTSTRTFPTIRPPSIPSSYPTEPMPPSMVPTTKTSKTSNIMLKPILIYSMFGMVIVVLCVMIFFLLIRKKKKATFSPGEILKAQSTFANMPALPDYVCDSSEERLEGEEQLEGEEREGVPDTGGFVTPQTIAWTKSGTMRMLL